MAPVREPSINDPIALLLEKAVDEMNSGSQPNGDIINFQGAQFRISFYKGYYNNFNKLKGTSFTQFSKILFKLLHPKITPLDIYYKRIILII